MRRDQNKCKKIKRRLKKEAVNRDRAKELETATKATLPANQYKAVAWKYMNLWRKTTQVRKNRALVFDETVNFIQSHVSVPWATKTLKHIKNKRMLFILT